MKTIAATLLQMTFMATLLILVINPGLIIFAFRLMKPELGTMVGWIGQFFSN